MKVKEHLQKTKEKEFELDWSFQEWLDYFSKEPTSKELDDMERECFKISSINNTHYQPLQGAQMNAGVIIGILIAVGTVVKEVIDDPDNDFEL